MGLAIVSLGWGGGIGEGGKEVTEEDDDEEEEEEKEDEVHPSVFWGWREERVQYPPPYSHIHTFMGCFGFQVSVTGKVCARMRLCCIINRKCSENKRSV